MSASALPRVVTADGEFPVYYMRSTADDATHPRYVPFLPASGWRWATPDEVVTAHTVLDEHAVTVVLFADLAFNPATATDADAVAALDHELAECHCHLSVCEGIVAREFGDYPDSAPARYAACRQLAARLMAVSS